MINFIVRLKILNEEEMNKRDSGNRHRIGKDKLLSDYWLNLPQFQRSLYIKQLKKWKFYIKD